MYLYTITAYPPSVGGAQLQTQAFIRHMNARHAAAVMYQWDENRSDWLFGTTLNAPDAFQPSLDDGIPAYRLSLTQEQRQQLRPWVYAYPFVQGCSIERIASRLLDNIEASINILGIEPPHLIHNIRIGREGLSLASLRFAQRHKIPFVFTPYHHLHWQGWFYREYLKIYRAAQAVIVQTDFERRELVRLGIEPHKIHLLGVGPLLAPMANGPRFRQQYGLREETPIILFLGQKYPYKGYKQLLEAAPRIWAQHPDVCFIFIGPRTSTSQKIFARWHDPRILEIDTVDLQTKTDALEACNILAVPSQHESFGGVFLEAWMFGKPVIGGPAPASQEIIHAAQGGYTASRDLDSLATLLLTLLHDEDLRTALGRQGQIFAQSYTWSALIQKLSLIYEHVI